MRKLSRLITVSMLLLICVSASYAQVKPEANSQPPALTVTVFAAGERVRFTAPASVVQMRLEVYDAAGRKLYDNELRGGNVLDWLVQDGQAARLPDDTYLCVVTVKGNSGRFKQKLGAVVVEQGSARAIAAAQLTSQQAAAIGPVEENAALNVVKEDEAQPGTVIAHNGEEGQLVRGRGALSFRLGDFYSGKDQEQMRLTAEGKLGIGVSDPQAKLDVAGPIRTSEGIVFPDGTVQTTAYVASGRSLSERVGLQRDAQGRSGAEAGKPGGSQQHVRLAPDAIPGRLAKFGGDGVTPVDTQVSESNGALVVGNAGATGNIQIFGTATADVFAGMGPDVVNGPAFNYGYAGSSFGRSAGFFNVRPDASAVAPNPSLRFLTANVQRMIITNTGNVGIGTTTPANRLDVNGGIRAFFNSSTGVVAETTGGTNAWARFHMNTPSQRWFIGTSNNFNGNQFYLLDDSNGQTRMTIQPAGGTIAFPLGNIGIGTSTPAHRLSIAGGPLWTANAWQGALELANGLAIGWKPDAAGQSFGIGQADGGLYFFRSISAPGATAAPALYDMQITDNGDIAQPVGRNGVVKAMLYVAANYTIIRCYNGVTGTTNDTCGFFAQPDQLNSELYEIRFNFEVGNRFVSITPGRSGNAAAGAYLYSMSSNRITVGIYTVDDGNPAQADFTVIVY